MSNWMRTRRAFGHERDLQDEAPADPQVALSQALLAVRRMLQDVAAAADPSAQRRLIDKLEHVVASIEALEAAATRPGVLQ